MDQEYPRSLIICNGAFAFDGGSTHLSATDETGKNHNVLLVQHAFAKPNPPPNTLPGRLYFNGELVAVRSAVEGTLLQLLRNANVRIKEREPSPGGERISPNALVLGDDIKRVVGGSPEQNLRAMLQGIVDYVGSDQYVSFAAKIEEMRSNRK